MSDEHLPVPVDLTQLPTTSFATDDAAFKALAKGGDWLPYIQLMTWSSEPVKDGLAKPGHFYLRSGKETMIDLTESYDCMPLSVRAKALDRSNRDAPVSVFDQNDPLFVAIQERAPVKDSACQAGPEYLIWIPGHGFALFFFGSPTLHRTAPIVRKHLLERKPCTLSSRIIVKQRNKWHGANCNPCSAFDNTGFPTMEVVLAEVNRFNNPPKKEQPELAPQTGDAGRQV